MHLDVGCGPANIFQEHVRPRLRTCRRVVPVDHPPYMLEYATINCRHPEVTFDLIFIKQGDPQHILDLHDSFDRIFVCPHFPLRLELDQGLPQRL
ncbi:hypothetical protein HPB48_022567 [Haemaphysalis longicornis]|uniref:Methyltransferase type 11 domain-containing protein n=1 Tax=Haemaphysalis longicornis TaxID=44386 RepID=A0A9J6H2T5_HAELO|nr:hypothetical protein HPB48_022567 [Haemaphysalis longicornis]